MVHMLQIHNEKLDAFALWLGRIGFCSRGFVWASVGAIAISAAFTGENTQGTQGALEVIADHPGGAAFLIIITLGLLCYSAWRFTEGLYGLQIKQEQHPFVQVVRGIITPFASCLAYIVFAVVNVITIRRGIGKGENFNLTAKMADYTAGKVALFVIAFFLFVTAVMWIVDLIKASLFKDLDLKKFNKSSSPIKIAVVTFAYLGVFGRAILFALLSVLFFRIIFDDDLEGGGFGVALQQLQYNTTARIFLVLFGYLIFLFGCFSVTQAYFKAFYRYDPHFRSSQQRAANEALFKTFFSRKAVSKEVRYDKELDKNDDQRKVQEGVKEMHPETEMVTPETSRKDVVPPAN